MSGQALRSPCAARVGGWPLARAAARAALVLTVLLAAPLAAQAPQWEAMPNLPYYTQRIGALGFLEGDTPATDSLVAFFEDGVFFYNPSGAGGAAGDNGEYHPWHRLCGTAYCLPNDGLVTASGALVIATGYINRSTDRGRTWDNNTETPTYQGLFQTTPPVATGPDGTPVILNGVGFDGQTYLSYGDGAPGTWVRGGGAGDAAGPVSFGEVPPSSALPAGRILYGTRRGPLYSDDGGYTYVPSNAFVNVWTYSFAFLPQAGHPYGGVTYAGVDNFDYFPNESAVLMRSEDGGATYTEAHRFTAAETGQPPIAGAQVAHVELLATPDGALWAGVGLVNGTGGARRGGIMRSTDGGVTWARADAGFAGPDGRGYRVQQLKMARDGRLYAATDRGVWRTTASVVASAAAPEASVPGVTLAVHPNPAGASADLTVTAQTGGEARVTVVDVQGREVARVYAGPVLTGATPLSVDVSGLAPGVYVVRADVGGDVRTTRLIVAR